MADLRKIYIFRDLKELSKIIGYGYVKGRNKTRMGNPDENCMTDYSQSEKK